MIAFLVARHYAKHVMHTTAHVPLKKAASALRINIEILLVALNKQLILAVPVKVGELVALPGSRTIAHTVGSIFGFDEVMIDSGTHMTHIDTTEQAMPVSIVGLRLPQVRQSFFCCVSGLVDCIVDPQHFFVLVVNLIIAHQEITPKTSSHKLQDIVASFVF